MTNELITGSIGTIVTATLTFFFTKKREQAKVKKSELENVTAAIEIWRNTAEQLKKDLIEMRNQYAEITEQNRALIKKVDHLEKLLEANEKKHN